MKMITSNNKYVLTFFIFIACYLGLLLAGYSQVGDPGGDDDVPITGIEWLLLGGGLFGARKVFLNFRKRKNQA